MSRTRHLRKNLTDAELFLWQRLRKCQIEGVRFRRQFPIDTFIVDFVCLEKRLVIELDGGQHAQQETYDAERDAHLRQQGFRVLRFWNHVVFKETEAVLTSILDALSTTPLPDPPPQGGREPGKRAARSSS